MIALLGHGPFETVLFFVGLAAVVCFVFALLNAEDRRG